HTASAVVICVIQVLICRNYRGDVDMSEIEHFMTLLMDKEEEGTLSPILAHGGVRFMWIKHNNLYPVCEHKLSSARNLFIFHRYITQEGHKLDTGAPRPPATVTNAVSWRSEGIKYRKNEVFLDVIEILLLKFNKCLNVSKSQRVKPLIWIESVIEKHSHSRIEYMIKAKSQFKRRSTANNVEIHIPVPTDADTPKFKTTVGSVKWVPENSEIVWSIKSFPGGKEYLMRAHFGLPSVEAEDKEGKPPISVKFEIPYFTTSGIQVRYLKIIEKSGYQALPWVRYITQNGGKTLSHPLFSLSLFF
uniref:AP-1 complex subunit mu-1-like n=1 Tax=Sinocyclocheilus rhinocerous TaxID=307959 RepID=A0A673KS07_9TELE